MSPALYCRYNGMMVPILVRLVGYDVDDGYIRVVEYTSIDGPVPYIEMRVEVNMERIIMDIGRISNN